MSVDLTFLSTFFTKCYDASIFTFFGVNIFTVLGVLLVLVGLISLFALSTVEEPHNVLLCSLGAMIVGILLLALSFTQPAYINNAEYSTAVQELQEQTSEKTHLTLAESDAETILKDYADAYYHNGRCKPFSDLESKEIILYDAQNNGVKMAYIMNSGAITFSYIYITTVPTNTSAESVL